MELRLIAFAGLGVALMGCAGTDATPAAGNTAAKALTTEAGFRDAIVGKTIDFQGNTFVANADNSISGPWDGSGITGSWYWDGAYWCREIAIGGEARPLDCQAWTVTGTVATIVRDRGTGSAFDYVIR